LVFNHIIHSTK